MVCGGLTVLALRTVTGLGKIGLFGAADTLMTSGSPLFSLTKSADYLLAFWKSRLLASQGPLQNPTFLVGFRY